ncbi:MAG: VOC family protein [Bacteroidota bacterium]
MIKGLYETHLYVEDLERSIDFYANTLGLQQCHYEHGRRIAFFWIGKPKQFMLGLWEKPKDEIESRHFAFECDPEWILNESVQYLKKRGLNFWNFLNDGTERPMVFAWMPAIAIYFSDPDGHALEFIGILEGEGRPEKGVVSYEEWLSISNN